MRPLKQLLGDYKLVWRAGVQFPPRPQDIFDLTRGNIREFLALVQQTFDSSQVNCYERTPLEPSWSKEGPSPFRLQNTVHEPDLSQIILVSEVNGREHKIDVDTMGAVKFAFLEPSRQNYSPMPSGVYVATSYNNPYSLNPWYGRREIILARDYPTPKLRKL